MRTSDNKSEGVFNALNCRFSPGQFYQKLIQILAQVELQNYPSLSVSPNRLSHMGL